MHHLLPPTALAELERLRLVVPRLPGRLGGSGGAGRPGGFGIDFHEHRPYVPGDDLRRVDWRRWQRTGELLTRSDLDRAGHAVTILLDRSGSMGLGEPPKLAFAVRVAAAVAFAGLRAGHPVGLVAFAGSAGAVVPARAGLHWLETLLGFLAEVLPGGPTALRDGLQGALSGVRREGRVVLLSDMLDPAGVEPALDLLAGPRRAADVVEIEADGEDALPVGETIDGLDPETGERRTFTVTPDVASTFRKRLVRTRDEVAAGCQARGLVHLRVTSGAEPVSVVRALAAAHS